MLRRDTHISNGRHCDRLRMLRRQSNTIVECSRVVAAQLVEDCYGLREAKRRLATFPAATDVIASIS